MFYKEKSGEARSRKPSQPGWLGSYEEALTNLACSSRTGEYWPSVVFVRTSRCLVLTVTTWGQYSPVRPSHSVSKRLVFYCLVIRGAWSPTATSRLSRIPLNNFGRRFGYSRSLPFNQRESGTQIGPNRKKEIWKTTNHIGYQNQKSASIFFTKLKTRY